MQIAVKSHELKMSVEPWLHSAVKGIQEVFSPTCSSRHGHLWGQSRFPGALFSLVSGRDCMSPLRDTICFFTVLVVKNIYLMVRLPTFKFHLLFLVLSPCIIVFLNLKNLAVIQTTNNRCRCLAVSLNSCHMHWEMQQPALLSIFIKRETSLMMERSNFVSTEEHYAQYEIRTASYSPVTDL